MPTFRHGKSAVIKMIHAGSTYALSTTFDDSSLQRAVDTAEVTTYGDSDKEFLAGLRGGSFSFKGPFDKTMAGYVEATLGSTALPTFQYGPEGNTTGRRKYTFSAVVTQWNTSSPIGDRVAVDGAATISGAVTSTTWA